jgi:ABC-2 type transport system permease protein
MRRGQCNADTRWNIDATVAPMNVTLRSLRPIIVKEFRQISRDPTSLGMLLVLPAALIVYVGYALNFDVKHVPLAVFDQSKTPESRTFLEKFKHTDLFDYRYEVSTYDEIEEMFLHGTAKIAIVLSPTFADDRLAGRDVQVQLLVDGSDGNTGAQAVANASRITADYSSRLIARAFAKNGKRSFVPIDFRARVWYNPDLLSNQFLLPGLIGFILVLTAVISTSLTVVREKERGTMEQIMVSPLRPIQVIMGKTLPYLFISLLEATAILLLGYVLFDVHIKGSLLVLYAGIILIVFGALGQGLLISTVTDSQQVAFMVSVFSSLLPSFLLSGFIFPVSSMPVVLQVLSNLAVNKFFLVVVRGVMLKGVGMGAVWPQFVYMTVFAILMVGISTRRMRKRAA